MKNIQVILTGNFMGGGGGMGGGMMGGISQAASGVMQMGVGIGNAVRAKKEKKIRDDNTPSEQDQRQVDIVDALRRKRLAQQSGASTAQSQGARLINQNLAGSRNASIAMSGGGSGALMKALSNSAEVANDQINNLYAQAEKDATGTMVLENAAQNDVVQRKMDVQMLKYNQANAQYNAEKKAAQQNLMAGGENIIGGVTSAIGGGGGGKTKSGVASDATGGAGVDLSPEQQKSFRKRFNLGDNG